MPVQMDTPEEKIRNYYRVLYRFWGPQNWWPAQSRFEVIVGAYLTQNTAWTNVEKALANLRSAKLLSLPGIRRVPVVELERLIRPAGYFRQKARRLKIFVEHLDRAHGGLLSKLFSRPIEQLREELLSLNGVGPETADSILLYAGNYPAFVVDAYSRRILERHEILPDTVSYENAKALFERALTSLTQVELITNELHGQALGEPLPGVHLPSRISTMERTALVQVYNEMHGLIVGVGKTYCRKSQPRCDQCPLQPFLPTFK